MEASSETTVSPFVNKVFDLELLREMILEYFIFDTGNGMVRRKKRRRRNARTCRLVSKAWLQSTSRILLKLNKPLFEFDLNSYKTPLANFVESVVENKHLDQRVPPFKLWANTYLFAYDQEEIFLDCLTHCGSGLVELFFVLADEHASMTLRKNLRLPKLQSLTVVFGDGTESNDTTDTKMDAIQSIFDASQQLKSFYFWCHNNHSNFGSNKVNNLVLPSTLTDLCLECEEKGCTVDVLLKSAPPKLKSLKLVNSNSFENGVLTSTLENVRKTLEIFTVGRRYCRYDSRRSTTFRLPFMEKLKRLRVDTTYLDLEGHLSCLEQLVPNLSHMALVLRTTLMFWKWTEGSIFESVNSLTVSFSKDKSPLHLVESNDQNNFDVGTMRTLKAAFPNLVVLDISFYVAPVQSVFVVIMEMTKLKSLTIRAGKGTREIASSDVFDALFLGIPEDSVAALKYSPELWKDLPEDEKTTSICNLTDLETLQLNSFDRRPRKPAFSFISDLVFELAFLKMPRLTTLNFNRSFFASHLMTEKWRSEGRTIIAVRFRPLGRRKGLAKYLKQ